MIRSKRHVNESTILRIGFHDIVTVSGLWLASVGNYDRRLSKECRLSADCATRKTKSALLTSVTACAEKDGKLQEERPGRFDALGGGW